MPDLRRSGEVTHFCFPILTQEDGDDVRFRPSGMLLFPKVRRPTVSIQFGDGVCSM
jgi:hypothetical protein